MNKIFKKHCDSLIPADKFGRVAVLMGGCSAEREISLLSGARVLSALQQESIDAYAIDVSTDIFNTLHQSKFDRVFNVLHGAAGENGNIQGLLEILQIPYTGSGVLASALTMDKVRSKLLWQAVGLPVLPYELLTPTTDPKQVINALGLPLVIKPIFEGSSLGVSIVREANQFVAAYQAAAVYGHAIMAEPYLAGGEYTVAIIGEETYPVIRIKPAGEFYDYHAKYFAEDTRYLIPSGLTSQQEQHAKNIALAAFQTVGCRHWGRVDLLADNENNLWIMEINTIPGMTEHSLVPMAARAKGLSFDDLVIKILALSVSS